jgi:SWI/SNF-related matrix-associated actin-dependent regulator 1 of chromatin subfamily A
MKLRTYQKTGVQFMLDNPRCILADEMGLGKTYQVIELLNLIRPKTIVIICPKSLICYWQREIRDHFKEYFECSWVITSYERVDRDLYSEGLDILIVDEAHYVKNKNTQRSKTVKTLAQRAKRLVFLTGTPMPNGPWELWSLLNMIDPNKWPSFMQYTVEYCEAGYKYVTRSRRVWDFSGVSNADKLKHELSSVMIRRLKTDVLKELPPKTRQLIPIEINAINDSDLIFESVNVDNYYSVVKRLRSDKVLFAEWSKRRLEQGILKIPKVIAYSKSLLQSGVEKLIIFVYHREVHNRLSQLISQDIRNCFRLSADYSEDTRVEAIELFTISKSPAVLVASLGVSAVGFNITCASHAIFAELDPTPATMNQAEDRMHRIGQVNPVLVQHLVIDGSLDAQIAKILVRKQEALAKILDSESQEQK